MYIPDDLVEEIRSRNDIVDIVSSRIKLQKKGSSYFGLCPFHNEKSPSFSVSPNKQMFYCFGCGEGGNVFSFLMKYDNLTFSEALKELADRAGVELPDVRMSAEERNRSDLKNTVYDINKEAARYYHYLLETETGNNARAYFNKRELSNDTIKSFGLGVSGIKSDDLYHYIKNKGYNDGQMKESGLFIYDEKGAHDRFRNRVMFPIINTNNKVIGFGGRVMGEGQPKYLNSPETIVFDKGRNLYGLNAAKNSRKNNIIICEGYMDVISMHQAGFNQAVASLGTALTDGQANLIKRYVKDVLVCYDSDGPGTKASLRAIGIFRNAGLRTKVINMEPCKDADEFIKTYGADAFQKRIDDAENSFLYEVRILERNYDLNDPAGKTSFFNEVSVKLASFEEEIERNNYIEAVASKYFVSADSLRKLVAKYAAAVAGIKVNEIPKREKREKENGIDKSQRMLLTFIADDTGIYKKIADYISPEDFSEGIYRNVAEIMFKNLSNGTFNPGAILNYFNGDDEHNEVARILNTNILEEDADNKDREKAVNDALLIIKRNSLEMKSRTTTDIMELQNIIKEQAKLKTLHISLS